VLTAGVLFFATACEESPSKIGAGLLPGSDYVTIKSTDSIIVKSYTMYSDSVRSENPAVSYLGEMYDPYFGTTTGGFVSQLWLNSNMTGEDFVAVDSVKLYLRLLTVKGDTTSEHILKMSEISQRIYDTLPYYSNQTVPLTGDEWDIALPTLRADTINDIVVTIPNTFGEHLIRDKSMLFMKDSTSASGIKIIIPDFRSYFAGLSFKLISPTNPVFVSLSIQSVGTTGTPVNYFTVYTHNGVQVSSSYDFLLGARHVTASFDLFNHDFSTAEAGKKIKHINDGYADSLSYLQNMNGVYTRIDIPFLKAMKSNPDFKNIAINKARLIIPFVYDSFPGINYAKTLPSVVYLRYASSTGKKHVVQDYLEAGATFYDGKPDTVTSMSYNINMAAYLQKYLNDATDTITTSLELFLLSSSEYNTILAANNNHKRVKFEFTYTKF
jgi:hypothetical protein